MIRSLHKWALVATVAIGVYVYILYARTARIYEDTVVTSTGDYRLSDNRRLKVWYNDANFVRVRLTENEKLLIEYNEPASKYQTYRILWESATRRLWVDSSDIGTTVYIPSADSKYVATSITPHIFPNSDRPQMLIEQVPPDIRAKLDPD